MPYTHHVYHTFHTHLHSPHKPQTMYTHYTCHRPHIYRTHCIPHTPHTQSTHNVHTPHMLHMHCMHITYYTPTHAHLPRQGSHRSLGPTNPTGNPVLSVLEEGQCKVTVGTCPCLWDSVTPKGRARVGPADPGAQGRARCQRELSTELWTGNMSRCPETSFGQREPGGLLLRGEEEVECGERVPLWLNFWVF